MKKYLPILTASFLFLLSNKVSAQENFEPAIPNTETKVTRQYDDGGGGPENRSPWFARKYEAQLGFFIPSSNTNMRIGNNNGIFGTDIELERDLGLKKSTFSGYAAFTWHISRRSRLSLSYFYIGRSATKTLEKDITFKDTTFHASATVSTLFNTHIGRITYGYAVFSKPEYEAGILIGSHIINMNAMLELNTSAGNLNYEDQTKFTAPLPDIGVFGGWAITDKWAINGEFSYLPVNISAWSIKILSYNLAVQYQPVNNLSFSLSLTGLNFKLSKDGDPLNGYVEWGYQGPALTAIYRFGRHF